ncbi:hypothetical protein [Cupriavidus basilensis]|uniref:hypothetical protein n=1 Tax=Cupriavidus basilensis TaxID=68895 RepID=UPI0002F57633|nr:hypothetical protein [Cupriavidus basilensis]
MLEFGGHFAAIDDPSAEILVPMCINVVVGLGADRKRAETSAANATAGWGGSPSAEPDGKRTRKAG